MVVPRAHLASSSSRIRHIHPCSFHPYLLLFRFKKMQFAIVQATCSSIDESDDLARNRNSVWARGFGSFPSAWRLYSSLRGIVNALVQRHRQ